MNLYFLEISNKFEVPITFVDTVSSGFSKLSRTCGCAAK